MTGISYHTMSKIVRELDEKARGEGTQLFSDLVSETWAKMLAYSHLARIIDAREKGLSMPPMPPERIAVLTGEVRKVAALEKRASRGLMIATGFAVLALIGAAISTIL